MVYDEFIIGVSCLALRSSRIVKDFRMVRAPHRGQTEISTPVRRWSKSCQAVFESSPEVSGWEECLGEEAGSMSSLALISLVFALQAAMSP